MENNNNISLDEIRAALEARGLDIKALAQEAKMLKTPKAEAPAPAPVKTSTPKKDFELVLTNYPDIVIQKNSPKTIKQLVIMPSCEGYFIKTIKNNGTEDTVLLNRENYAQFTSGMEPIELPEGYWAKTIESGMRFYDELFLNFLLKEGVSEMIKVGCIPHSNNSPEIKAFKKYKNLCRKYWDNDIVISLLSYADVFVDDMIDRFGLEKTQDFFDSINQSLIDLKINRLHPYSYNNNVSQIFTQRPAYNNLCSAIPPQIKCGYEQLKEYILYQSVYMGYALTMRTFFQEWNDCIKMQLDLYGKVKEKYPECLPMYHAQLAYKCALKKEEIDANKFAKNVEIAQKYEKTIDDYVFLAPKCKEDFFDEATAQANCLASYVNKFTEGHCLIFFMRKKDTPDESLVTIEVVGEKLTQAYQARNKSCTSEQKEVVDKWFKSYLKSYLND